MTRTGRERLTWAKICEHHWDEWVLLADVEEDGDRAIRFARVLDHDESMTEIMDRNETLPGTTLIQTAGRPLWWLTRPHLIVEPDEEVPGLAPGATFAVTNRR
jgi:hypothetical protein